MSSQDDLPMTWDEIATGYALYEEHKPQCPGDWIAIAARWREDGIGREGVSHLFEALAICVDALSNIAESQHPHREGVQMAGIALDALEARYLPTDSKGLPE